MLFLYQVMKKIKRKDVIDMSKQRTTVHKGKVGNAKHNEHDFYEKDARDATTYSFIHQKENVRNGHFDLEKDELKFYERYLGQLISQNEKYEKKGNYSRVKSLEDFYKSKRYQPTEEILQYGNIGTDENDMPDKKTFKKMTETYATMLDDWSKLHGNHLHVLEVTRHFDESTPHAHLRYIWDANIDGITTINQEKAMEQAGLELPHPDKPVSRYNNRNMTFTAICRNMWNDVCEQYGFEVERVPLENGRKKSETIPQYHARMGRELKAREEELQKGQDALKAREREIVEIIGDITGYNYKQSYTVEEAVRDLSDVKDTVIEQLDKLDDADKLLEEASDRYATASRFYLQEQEWLSEEGKKHRKVQAEEEAKKQQEIQKERARIARKKAINADVAEMMAKWGEYVDPNSVPTDEDDYLPT